MTAQLPLRLLLATLGAAVFVVACANGGAEDQLRLRLEGFFEATLNGDVAALDDYVSDACEQKTEFLENAQVLRILEEVDVVVPEGAMLFDFGEGNVAVAKRALDGPPVLIDGMPSEDDPSNDVPLKLAREDGVWRVVNCDAYLLG